MSDRAEDIRRHMVAIRSYLADDVEDVIRSARQMLNWREYVRHFPWACVGIAMAIGYLSVPRRLEVVSPDTDMLLQWATRNKLVVKAEPSAGKTGGVLGAAASIVATALVRGAASYVGRRLNRAVREHDQVRDDAPNK